MKGYMIRYALSKGIRTVDIERVFDNGSAFVTWKGGGATILEDDELFRTKEVAERMADEAVVRPDVRRWIRRLKRLIRDTPKGVQIFVNESTRTRNCLEVTHETACLRIPAHALPC